MTHPSAGARAGFSDRSEVFCQTVFDVSSHSPSDGVGAAMASRRSPNFAGLQRVGTPERLSHVPDCYLITLQLSGHSRIAQDGASVTLAPSEIAILRGQRPFHIELPGAGSRIMLVVPRDMADRSAPWLRLRTASKLMTAQSPYADLARQHLLHLAAESQDLSANAANLLIDNLFNLFTLANTLDAVADGARGQSALEPVLAFCRRNLHEARLSPRFVAAHFGISVRTLHLRFEKFGQSFNRWLIEVRLEACAKALRDQNWGASTISEVAYRCGFNDLSHFNRTFRARFDTTPRQWRARLRFP